MDPKKRSRTGITVLYCLVQMLYWSSGFTTVGFAAAYLGKIGFSNGTIGLISAAAGLAGFALVLGLSVRIDRAGTAFLYRLIAGILLIQIALILVFASVLSVGALSAVLYTLFLALGHVMNSLFSRLYFDIKRRGIHIDFGIARGLGSLAYAGCSFAVGYVLAQHPKTYVHSFTLLFYLLLLLVLLTLQRLSSRLPADPESIPDPEEKKTPLRVGAFLRNYRFFLILVLGISLVSASNKTFTTFLVNVVQGVGGDTRSFTTITGFLALVEIPVMLLFSKIRRRSSVSTMLLLSLLLYAVKLGGAAAARSLPVLFAAVTAQTFAAGLYHPASVEFVRETIPHKDTAKCQALLDGAPVCVSFLTITGFGALLESLPTRTVCFFLFAFSVIGIAISRAVIRKIRNTSEAR